MCGFLPHVKGEGCFFSKQREQEPTLARKRHTVRLKTIIVIADYIITTADFIITTDDFTIATDDLKIYRGL